MKELFRDPDFSRVAFFQTLLESEGIPVLIENEALSVTAIPIPEFHPALCVLDDGDYGRAVEVIRKHLATDPQGPRPERICPSCGESSPGNFGACWNCGSALESPPLA